MSDKEEVYRLIQKMADQLQPRIESIQDSLLMIGIHTGGLWVAEHLHKLLKIQQPLGSLDISFYRDDFSRIGMNPQVKPSTLPTNIDDKNILLIDDILHTGRTIRAAMNEIFDYGRPATITLAILGDRGGRELPIQPDVVGKRIELKPNEHVKLVGPDNLHLSVMQNQPKV